MAELTALGYFPGNSLVHRLDVRVKMLGLLGVSAAALRCPAGGLAFIGLALAVLMGIQQLPLRVVVRQLRLFGLLLVFVWVTRALVTPGESLVEWGPLAISRAGARDGALICGRLVVTLATGVLFTAATRPSELKAATHWLLTPVPGIPAGRVAVMVSLVMRFFPTILMAAREVHAAQQARCIQCRRNPIYRTLRLAVPLLRKTFQTADELTLAMEARCFTAQRSDPALEFHTRDRWALVILVVFLTPLFFM